MRFIRSVLEVACVFARHQAADRLHCKKSTSNFLISIPLLFLLQIHPLSIGCVFYCSLSRNHPLPPLGGRLVFFVFVSPGLCGADSVWSLLAALTAQGYVTGLDNSPISPTADFASLLDFTIQSLGRTGSRFCGSEAPPWWPGLGSTCRHWRSRWASLSWWSGYVTCMYMDKSVCVCVCVHSHRKGRSSTFLDFPLFLATDENSSVHGEISWKFR